MAPPRLLLENDPPTVRAALSDAFAPLPVAARAAVVEGDEVTVSVLLPPASPPDLAPDAERDPLADALGEIALSVTRTVFAAAPGIAQVLLLIARDPGGTALPRPLAYGRLGRAFALADPPPGPGDALAELIEEGALFRRATSSGEALVTELPQRAELRAALAVAALRGR